MLLDQLDVAEQSDPITLALDLGNETPARDGVRIVRPHAQWIAEIAEGFERHAVGRPAFELIWAVGHQELPALFVKRLERGPTFAGVVGADQRLERIGAVSLALEALEEAGKALLRGVGADEIEPIHATTPSLGLRKCGPAAIDRLLHQHQKMPGQRAPGWRDDRILLGVHRWNRGVDVNHEQLANVFEVSEPKGF